MTWRTASGLRGRRAGLSLVELIVSVGILGLVVGFILQLVPLSHVANRKAWAVATASDVARVQMESMRAAAFSSFDTLPASLGPTTETHGGTAFTWTVSSGPYRGSSSLKLVTVSVSWHQTTGDQRLVAQGLVARQQLPQGTPTP